MNELSGYVFSSLREGDIALYRGSGNGLTPILLVAVEESSPGCVERLEHEYALKSELDADWAARPVALTHDNGRMKLVLEDPGGTPLDRLLGRPLDVSHFLRIAIPLAGAFRHVHERGLIHKDIKPANILVESASSGVWLTGFGIASRLPRERQAPAPPEVIAGTLAYMAPEQTGRMNRSIDSRSDLYALGVTFYQMLTGSLPFTAADPMEWVHCHIARKPLPPSERVQLFENNRELSICACWYWIRKLQAGIYVNDSVAAIAATTKVTPLLWTAPTQIEQSEYQFYGALAQAARRDEAPADERSQHLAALADHSRQIAVTRQHSPGRPTGREPSESLAADGSASPP
jgi:serine/threonine protein kinase